MNSLWKCVRNIVGVIGLCLVWAMASTSDYYVLTLKEPEPGYVWPLIYVGVVLMLPTVIHVICEYQKEESNGKDHL